MMKRIVAFYLILLLSISCGNTVQACDEDQINTYVLQILFGDNALSKTSDENVEMLLDALYLCSMQSDGQGKDKVEYLKHEKVSNISNLSGLDIDSKNLLECSHNSWEHIFSEVRKQQKNRKEVLQNTINKIFDFGLFNNWFGSKKGKCNSFAALLYYSHILSDYLADEPTETEVNINGEEVFSYTGESGVILNGNKPLFTEDEKSSAESFMEFNQLDRLGRAGTAFASIGPDILAKVTVEGKVPNGIEPSGWNQNEYEGFVAPPYLFNRCHLLAHQLGGVEKEINLITGTRYLNEAMKSWEDNIAEYIKNTGNHVLYRVTPVFKRDNRLASGVQLEAYSVEDNGQGICFNVYCYNVQPGIKINYTNGENDRSDDIFGEENVLPFVVRMPGADNPDLIYEMSVHLKELFDTPENKNMYNAMIGDITSIANEARALEEPENAAKYYIELKKYEYDYLEVLRSYVPLLLKKEKFFQSVFN